MPSPTELSSETHVEHTSTSNNKPTNDPINDLANTLAIFTIDDILLYLSINLNDSSSIDNSLTSSPVEEVMTDLDDGTLTDNSFTFSLSENVPMDIIDPYEENCEMIDV